MKDIKNNLEKKMKDMGKRTAKDRIENKEKDGFKCRTINEKLCPFMSNAKYQVACTPQCKIYRADKGEYGCAFSELTSISWGLNGKKKKKN